MDASKNSSSAYQVNKERYDANYERIFNSKNGFNYLGKARVDLTSQEVGDIKNNWNVGEGS